MVSFTKSNLSLQKNIFLCSTESSLNYSYYTVFYFLCLTLSKTQDLLTLACWESSVFSLLSQGLKSQTDSNNSLLCRHNDNMPGLRRGESKGLSAEISQSAAAGLRWLSAGRRDHSGHVAGGSLSRFSTRINWTKSSIGRNSSWSTWWLICQMWLSRRLWRKALMVPMGRTSFWCFRLSMKEMSLEVSRCGL